MPEKPKAIWKSWGVRPVDGSKHQFGVHCPHCRHEEEDDFFAYIVGFSNDREEYLKPNYEGTALIGYRSLGVIVKECPKCFGIFYHHIHIDSLYLDTFNSVMEEEPEFFRVSGVKENFLKMLKELEKAKKKENEDKE